MSIDLKVHLGPYFRCEKQKVIRIETSLGCANCKRKIATDFCPTCGTARTHFETEFIVNKVCSATLVQKMNDRLYVLRDEGEVLDKKFDFYVPNINVPTITRKFDPIEDPSRENEFIYNGITLDVKKEFIIFFEKELLMLEEAYENKVLVQWGFLHCYR